MFNNSDLKKIIKNLASLKLALVLLFTIALIIAIGTIIEQDQNLIFYKENYPEINPLFGFLSWKIILYLNLNNIYTSWWFIGITALFGISLIACSFTTQIPSIKTFKLWKFYNQKLQFERLTIKNNIKLNFFNSTVYEFNHNNYHFFRQQKKSYAYSGLLGRVAPVVVHISIIILLIGSTIGSFTGFTAQQLVPRGEIAHIQNLTKFGIFTSIPQTFTVRVNDFWITYTKNVKTDQFYSDLSLLNKEGKEIKRKTVFVNEPLIENDIFLYQTDWEVIGLKMRFLNQETFQIPFKKITKNGQNFWLGTLNFNPVLNKNFSIVANNLTGTLSLYDEQGVFLKNFEIGNSVMISNNLQFEAIDFITSTGLQIKKDPGIKMVYFSFFLLMISIYVSFFSYSQIWLFETGKKIIVGGKSNRAVLFFQEDFKKIIKQITTL